VAALIPASDRGSGYVPLPTIPATPVVCVLLPVKGVLSPVRPAQMTHQGTEIAQETVAIDTSNAPAIAATVYSRDT
jgi:hypothetical protein